MDVIDAADRTPLIDEAARIWAEATAARDGHAQVPALDVSRPVIQGVLDRSSRAILLIARSADGTAAGFAAIEPAPAAKPPPKSATSAFTQGNGASASGKRCSWRHAGA